MSYSIQVTKRPDEAPQVTGHSGEIPDGVYTVNGHDDGTNRSISVSRVAHEHGQVQVQASGHARRTD